MNLLASIYQLPNPVPFTGLGSIGIHERGSNHWFGDVYYSANLPANVLSFAEISDRFKVEWNAEIQTFVVRTPSDVFRFVRKSNLYAHNVREHLCYVHVVTTTYNKAKYTTREVEMARQARELTQLLGYPSSKDLITLIKSGSIINCPVSAHDIARAIGIYDTDIASLEERRKDQSRNQLKSKTSVKLYTHRRNCM
jgi:hypothetical protein